MAVDSDSVYWANPNGGTVNQSGLDGSNPHALFADQFAPYGWPSARSEQGPRVAGSPSLPGTAVGARGCLAV